jgi:hypothetical protein
MKITSKDIECSKQNRDKFNKYYNDAVIDVIALKEECNMTIEQIKSATPYDSDFILHVFENYMINKRNENENNEYDLSVKINKYHKNIEQITEKYGEKMMEEIFKEEELKDTYYFSK